MRTLLLGSLLVFAALTATAVRAQDVDQAFTISIGSSTTDVGSQSSVELLIDDINASPVSVWTIDVAYLNDIISPVECQPLKNSVCDLEHRPNMLRVTGASAPGLTEETVLAVITFQCQQRGASPLSLAINLFDDGGVVYDVQVEDGELTCQDTTEPTKTPEITLPSTGTGSGGAGSNWPTVLLLSAGAGLLLGTSIATLRRRRA
ncbi:MAG: hypothetical protein IIC91_06005 [Chloroflexi bacterium]|nr:hypothetical protein [Chloroflexota bacterium]